MYTVKQLARLAGITPRTLHYYDEIGLLKPSHVGENGYRYYAEDALLHLQQILLYRELDLPLENIREILASPGFDLQTALESHRAALQTRITHLERVIRTVDNTLASLRGEMEMSNQQLFEPFNEEQQAEYEKEALQRYDPETVKASYKKWKNYTTADKQRIGEEGNAVYRDLLAAMPKGAGSPEVQACIERWRQHMDYFWTPNLEQLLGLANLYNDDPRFRANYDKVDPRLAPFMLEAVSIYVKNHGLS
ncbi:MAG: MerR family transcriptional regulator [Anaerolineales bacterium]|jgi:DNA-binding transcriptional MerR regulator|nr:MerR family transcriptional regulator [Anaerolineales bacterium]